MTPNQGCSSSEEQGPPRRSWTEGQQVSGTLSMRAEAVRPAGVQGKETLVFGSADGAGAGSRWARTPQDPRERALCSSWPGSAGVSPCRPAAPLGLSTLSPEQAQALGRAGAAPKPRRGFPAGSWDSPEQLAAAWERSNGRFSPWSWWSKAGLLHSSVSKVTEAKAYKEMFCARREQQQGVSLRVSTQR